jgi:hypothetical protein
VKVRALDSLYYTTSLAEDEGVEPSPLYSGPVFETGSAPQRPIFHVLGRRGRSRTYVAGVAVRCMATLPRGVWRTVLDSNQRASICQPRFSKPPQWASLPTVLCQTGSATVTLISPESNRSSPALVPKVGVEPTIPRASVSETDAYSQFRHFGNVLGSLCGATFRTTRRLSDGWANIRCGPGRHASGLRPVVAACRPHEAIYWSGSGESNSAVVSLEGCCVPLTRCRPAYSQS